MSVYVALFAETSTFILKKSVQVLRLQKPMWYVPLNM